MATTLRDLILEGSVKEISSLLALNPGLSDERFLIGAGHTTPVHPIHFVCDRVFEGRIPAEGGEEIVRTIVEAGADINDGLRPGKDSPLITACSLHCDDIAIYLIDKGADLRHKGTHGGTCLHWAAWTGAERVVKKLVTLPIDLENRDNEFECSPLLWAIHGLLNVEGNNRRNQRECILIMIKAGAKISSINSKGVSGMEILRTHNQTDLIDGILSINNS